MRYEAPGTIDQAVEILSQADGITRVLAGGTDVIVQMRSGMVEPDLLVDIKRIDGLYDITPEDGGFRIGAAVSGAQLGEHEGVKALWPGVVEATELIGSTQVQGRATMVGNLCNASPAADSVPALVAAGAMVAIVGPGGRREIPAYEVTTGPGKTSLEKGEIIESILLPARPARSGDAYLRFIPRTEMDIAVVGAGVSLTLQPGWHLPPRPASPLAPSPRSFSWSTRPPTPSSAPGSKTRRSTHWPPRHPRPAGR